MTHLSLVSIRNGAARAVHFFGNCFGAVGKADEIYHSLTPEAKAAALKTFADVLRFVAALEAAKAVNGTNFVLDENVVAIARELYEDALVDEKAAAGIFHALGIELGADPIAAKAA